MKLKNRKLASALILPSLALIGSAVRAQADLHKLPPASDRKDVTYATDIRPVLEASCFRCHGEERQRGALRLDSLEAVLNGGEDGKVVIPGRSQESPLVIAVAQLDEDTAMPPKQREGRTGGGPGGPGGPGEARGPGGRAGFGPGLMLARQMLSQADKNGDKKLTKEEFTALAVAWFDQLDIEKAGGLSREQFAGRLGDMLRPPQGFGPPGGTPPEGGPPPSDRRRFGPGQFIEQVLFTAADTDQDGSLTPAELKNTFARWFGDWDRDQSGSLDENEMREGLNAALPRPDFGGPRRPDGPGGRGGPGGPGRGNFDGPGNPGGLGGGNPPGRRDGGPPQGPGGVGGGFGPPAKPLTAEQIGLIRAWIDQGAK